MQKFAEQLIKDSYDPANPDYPNAQRTMLDDNSASYTIINRYALEPVKVRVRNAPRNSNSQPITARNPLLRLFPTLEHLYITAVPKSIKKIGDFNADDYVITLSCRKSPSSSITARNGSEMFCTFHYFVRVSNWTIMKNRIQNISNLFSEAK